MNPAIGIDFGTANSRIAIYRNDACEIIHESDSNNEIPSVVSFTEDDHEVGFDAWLQRTQNLNNTITSTKRLIGRSFKDSMFFMNSIRPNFEITNKDDRPIISVAPKGETLTFTPEAMSALVLAKLRKIASSYLKIDVTDAIVTVPASFDASQRDATKEACKTAGFNVLQIIDEPTAAAIAYGLIEKVDDERTVLVADFGAGSFDLSLITISKGKFTAKATGGDSFLGGEDIDDCLVMYLCNEFRKRYKRDFRSNKRALTRLRMSCEKAKESLSSSTMAAIELSSLDSGSDFDTNLLRASLEEVSGELFSRTILPVARILEEAKISKSEVDDVIMIGGSSRIPKVRRIMGDFFHPKIPIANSNLDEAVVHGAAVYAAILSGDTSSESISNLKLHHDTS